ncbi:MAG: glycosyltransferase family 2 protein, partial [Flavobacteriales bacterium]|nr:glycosyltransferase family 2 protein [Flavobacteriales bacterium]
SWKDAQGFRRADGRKLRVVEVDATIHHYGWVKDPRTMQRKQEDFNRLWHEDAEVERRVPAGDEWDYGRERRVLHPFAGTHPAVMKERL